MAVENASLGDPKQVHGYEKYVCEESVIMNVVKCSCVKLLFKLLARVHVDGRSLREAILDL